MNLGSSLTVREGVHRATRRPPLRSGYCPGPAVGVLTLSLLLIGCNTGARRSGIPAGAQAALDSSIEAIDAGRYDEVYEEASDEWRSQSTLDQSKATLQMLRDKLGRAHTRDLQTAREEQTGTAPVAGHSVTVIYQTSFDRGDGMETFTLVEHGGRWALAKYYVSSSGLR